MKKLLLALLLPVLAFAWEPRRPVTVVFPNGPGAGNEISFRFVASIVEKKTGATFVSEHRPGADGNIAMNHFATVPADGYTIAVPACQSNWVTGDIWYGNMIRYDAQDFEPVANIARSPLAFWAHPSSPVNTPQELAELIRSQKRPVNIAIGGGGHRLAVQYLVDSLKVSGPGTVSTPMYKGPDPVHRAQLQTVHQFTRQPRVKRQAILLIRRTAPLRQAPAHGVWANHAVALLAQVRGQLVHVAPGAGQAMPGDHRAALGLAPVGVVQLHTGAIDVLRGEQRCGLRHRGTPEETGAARMRKRPTTPVGK